MKAGFKPARRPFPLGAALVLPNGKANLPRVLVAYVVLGFVLSETEARTRQFFSGLAVIIREAVDKLAASLRGAFGEASGNRM